MEILFVCILGLCFGSFVSMASYRLPRDKTICTQHSHCPHCQHALGVRDLVPVVSWLASGGRCQHCKAKVSIRYPLTELACMGLFLLIYALFGFSVQAAILALFGVTLLTMLIADLETKLIPDEIHWALLVLGVAYHYWLSTPWLTVVVMSLVAGGLGLLLHYGYYFLRKRHGLGFGDVKFLFVAGLWLASLDALAAYIFYSGLFGVVFGLMWRFVSDDPRFPFGPALAVALFILVLWPSASSLYSELVLSLVRGL